MADPASIENQDSVEDYLDALLFGISAATLVIIADMLKRVKDEGWSYADLYANYPQAMEEYEKVLASGRATANAAVDSMLEDMATQNDKWAEGFYKASGTEQVGALDNAVMSGIIASARDKAREAIEQSLNSSVLGIVDSRGVFRGYGDYYRKAASDAITGMLAGEQAYTQAVNKAVKELTESGLRSGFTAARVQYESGVTRELYGALRMNIMDNYRQTLSDLRKAQGQEFGADGVEISAHALCAPDHVDYQGEQYSNKQFQQIQGKLARPFEEMNCRHIISPIILGISPKVYSDEELKRMKDSSEEQITFKGLGGNDLTMTRYEATQYQRRIEQSLRKAKTDEYLLNTSGVDSSRYKQAIKERTSEYNRISKEAGLPTKPERTRAYIAS